MWNLAKKDPAKIKRNTKLLNNPPEVVVEGYVFLDYSRKHAAPCKNKGSNNWCDRNAGRGIHRDRSTPSMVRGCWEIHPVLSVAKVSPQGGADRMR